MEKKSHLCKQKFIDTFVYNFIYIQTRKLVQTAFSLSFYRYQNTYNDVLYILRVVILLKNQSY